MDEIPLLPIRNEKLNISSMKIHKPIISGEEKVAKPLHLSPSERMLARVFIGTVGLIAPACLLSLAESSQYGTPFSLSVLPCAVVGVVVVSAAFGISREALDEQLFRLKNTAKKAAHISP